MPLKFEEWAAGIMIGLLGLITFANVVVRYLTNFSFAFTEEFSVFLMVLVALIGGSSVIAKNGHLRISFLVGEAPAGAPAGGRAGRELPDHGHVPAPGDLRHPDGLGRVPLRGHLARPGIPTWLYTMWLPVLALAICGRALGLTIRTWRRDG